jgi:hypothetical protein
VSGQDATGRSGQGDYRRLPEVIPSLWPRLTSLDRRYAERYYARIVANPAKYGWMLKLGHGEWRYAQLACTLAFYAVGRIVAILAAPAVLLIYFGARFSAILIALGVLAAAAAIAGLFERARVSRRSNAYFAAGRP